VNFQTITSVGSATLDGAHVAARTPGRVTPGGSVVSPAPAT